MSFTDYFVSCIFSSQMPRAASVFLSIVATVTVGCTRKLAMEPGDWEVVFDLKVDSSDVELSPMRVVKCVTSDAASDPVDVVKATQTSEDGCLIAGLRRAGEAISWTIDCGKSGGGTGSVTFARDRYDGTSHVEVLKNGAVVRKVDSKITARRRAACGMWDGGSAPSSGAHDPAAP